MLACCKAKEKEKEEKEKLRTDPGGGRGWDVFRGA
jgi:hypothetical protein